MKLNLRVKGGIISTISKAIYSTNIDKIREIIANSIDAKAKCIILSYNKVKRKLIIIDNGNGICGSEIKNIFESLGYGLKRDIPETYSHFGLGLISILQLSTTNTYIISRTLENHKYKTISVKINTKGLFDKKNEDKDLSYLNKYIELPGHVYDVDTSGAQLNRILEDNPNMKKKYSFNTYTEIVLHDVNLDVFKDLENSAFRDQLRRTLPLPINRNDNLFLKIKNPKLKNEMYEFFDDEKYCKTIDVFINDLEYMDITSVILDEKTNKMDKLYRYFPPFGNLVEINKENIVMGLGKNYKFYLLARVDDLFTKDEGVEGKKITGFSIRNKNVLVKENDFLEYDFIGDRVIKTALRSWLYGEIFHSDLNDVLQVHRRDFIENDPKFQNFINDFVGKINTISANLRNAYEKRKEIRDKFLTPFQTFISGKSFENIKHNIGIFLEEDPIEIDIFNRNIIKKMEKMPKKKWFNDKKYQLDEVLKRGDVKFRYQEMEIIITNQIEDYYQDELTVSLLKPGEDNILKLSSRIFEPKQISFLGETFDLKFVYLGQDNGDKESAVNYNITDNKKEVLINIFNKNIKNFKIDVLEVIILIDLAYHNSDNMDDMRNYLLNYLQDNYRSAVNNTIVERLEKYLSMKVNI